jgi:hypothetical protein
MFKGISEELKSKILGSLSDELKAELKGLEFVVGNDGSYLPATKLSEVTEKNRLLKESLEQLKTSLEEAKKGANTELTAQITALQEKYNADIKAKDKEFGIYKTQVAATRELEKAGVIYPDLLVGKLNFDGIDPSKDGAFKAQIDELKVSHAGMFKSQEISGTKPTDGLPIVPNGAIEQIQNKPNKSLSDFAAILQNIPKK